MNKLLLCLLITLAVVSVLGAEKRRKHLTDAELEKLEREWEADDEEEELKTSGQVLAEEMKKKDADGLVGATLMMVKLKPPMADSMAETEKWAARFKEYVATGGLQIRVYREAAGSVFIGLAKGWLGEELYELLESSPDVLTVDWQDRDKVREAKKKLDELQRQRKATKDKEIHKEL